MHLKSANRWMASLAMVSGVVLLAGCGEDPKQKIARLEQENAALSADLDKIRNELAGSTGERDSCQASLLAAQQDNEDLRRQLAEKPASDLPGDWKAVNGGAMVSIEGSVLFDAGKVTLKPSSQSVLNKLASEIRSSFDNKDIYVFGHTDTDPIKKSGWKDNRELSAERALAVVRYLQSQGVPANHLVACGWGEHRPIASNGSSDGKSKNRRVEFFAADIGLASSK